MMAKTTDETIKRDISFYFTTLKGTKTVLTGKELIALGFEPGPRIREILTDLLRARLDQKVDSEGGEIAFVKRKYGTPGESRAPSEGFVGGYSSPER
jgi:tRNA nucleotidyltransferase (CCA-adding enzyme)